MLRYRIRTLLLFTVVVALATVAFLPFKPSLGASRLTEVAVGKPFSRVPGRFRQFRITVSNDGVLPLWLRSNDIPMVDFSWFASESKDEPTHVEIDIHKERCTKLASGQSRTYDLLIHAEYTQFHLGVSARDWRGRDGYVYFGLYKIAAKTAN
jgi:hypothetical protein